LLYHELPQLSTVDLQQYRMAMGGLVCEYFQRKNTFSVSHIHLQYKSLKEES